MSAIRTKCFEHKKCHLRDSIDFDCIRLRATRQKNDLKSICIYILHIGFYANIGSAAFIIMWRLALLAPSSPVADTFMCLRCVSIMPLSRARIHSISACTLVTSINGRDVKKKKNTPDITVCKTKCVQRW